MSLSLSPSSSTWRNGDVVVLRAINSLGDFENAIVTIRNGDDPVSFSLEDEPVATEQPVGVGGFGIEHLRISSYTPAAPGDELTVVLTVAGAEHARARVRLF